MNRVKTMLRMVALSLMLVFIGGFVGGKAGMAFALVVVFGVNFLTYWLSDWIVVRMYRAQPVTEADAPELYAMVRRLAQLAELPTPKVCIMQQDRPKAFAMGRYPQQSVVAATTGILRILSKPCRQIPQPSICLS